MHFSNQNYTLLQKGCSNYSRLSPLHTTDTLPGKMKTQEVHEQPITVQPKVYIVLGGDLQMTLFENKTFFLSLLPSMNMELPQKKRLLARLVNSFPGTYHGKICQNLTLSQLLNSD